jgi:hypothetical protein
MDFPTTSPFITDAEIISKTFLTFGEAIEQILKDKRITKKDWGDERTYGLLKEGYLQIHKNGEAEETTRPWVFNEGDLLGKDWYVS